MERDPTEEDLIKIDTQDLFGTIMWIDKNRQCRKQIFTKSMRAYIPEYYYDENGYEHRISGPAIILGENCQWRYHGKRIECNSQEEYEQLLKLKVFW